MKKGFSLVEVLISLLILSIIMVAMTPVLTKKGIFKKNDGIVFTYREDNNTQEDDVCYTTTIDYDDLSESYTATTECSEYTFTVPEGVHYVNLTLQAGGGGGGGAGSFVKAVIHSLSKITTGSSTENIFNYDYLRKLIIGFSAKGTDGSDANSDCKNSTTYCGGKGGASSPAAVDIAIPVQFIRPDLSLSVLNSATFETAVSNGGITLDFINTINNTSTSLLKYSMGADYTTSCYKNGSTDALSGEDCYIQNIISSVEGDYGQTMASADSSSPSYLSGGIGGNSKYLANGCSAGGAGGSAQLVCSDSSCSYNDYTDPESGSDPCYYLYANADSSIGTGGGGAAGTVIRITGFPVTPNETYTIRVGKGGRGGAAGRTLFNSYNGGMTSYTENITGDDGEGGVSTAIYKDDTLVFMVNGGSPGQGGQSDMEIAVSGRNYAKVFSGTEGYMSLLKTDTSRVTSASSSDTAAPYNISNVMVLAYPALEVEPYKTLNLDGLSSTDDRYGGYSDFDIESLTQTSNTTLSNVTYANVYDGMYYEMLTENGKGYIGGLGASNGFGSKGGCGANFTGNFDGRYNSGANTADILKNKFIVKSGVYETGGYFDNCGYLTSDGQTAKFIAPDPINVTFGQAGAGGGGGGWQTDIYSGNGGRGQDGYLMIDWRR